MSKLLAFRVMFVAQKHISTTIQDKRHIYNTQYPLIAMLSKGIATLAALAITTLATPVNITSFTQAQTLTSMPLQTSRKETTLSNRSHRSNKTTRTPSRWPLLLLPGRSLRDLSTRSSKSTSTSRIATLSLVRIALGRDFSICKSTC